VVCKNRVAVPVVHKLVNSPNEIDNFADNFAFLAAAVRMPERAMIAG
jgi:hypothetical protein